MKVLATLLGLVGAPQWFSARGVVSLLSTPRDDTVEMQPLNLYLQLKMPRGSNNDL